MSIRGITIVNGAQTTGAPNASEATEDVKVLMRFVKCTDRAVVQDLIRANNTQNAIVSSDFRSTDRHQTRLREEFKAIPLTHYTGARRGEVAEAEAGDEDVHISADLAAQALAALHGEPQRAYHGKSRIWEDEPLYDRFFGPTSAAHIVYATSLVRAINDEKRRLRDKPERSQIEQRILEFLSQRGAPFLLAAAIGRCQEMIVDVAVTDLFRLSFGDQVSPAVAEEHWTPVVRIWRDTTASSPQPPRAERSDQPKSARGPWRSSSPPSTRTSTRSSSPCSPASGLTSSSLSRLKKWRRHSRRPRRSCRGEADFPLVT